MKSSSSNFMRYVYGLAKARCGKDYQTVVQEALFKYHCYKLRGKKKLLVDVLIEHNIITEEESKKHQILSCIQKAKENKAKNEAQKTEADKTYQKYKNLVQYFIYQYGLKKLPLNPAIDHEDIAHDCWIIVLQNVDFTKFHHKAVVAYIARVVRSQCIRSCTRMLHIRIPDHAFSTIRHANKKPEHEDSWKTLISPGNRFVVPLENDNIAIPEKENFQYEHLKDTLLKMLDKLSEKEKSVLKYRYGSEKKTLEEIGHILHCTRERVRQIEEISVQKLRRWIMTANELSSDDGERLRLLIMNEVQFKKTTIK